MRPLRGIGVTLFALGLGPASAFAQYSFTDLRALGFGGTDLKGLSPDGATIVGSTSSSEVGGPFYIQNGQGHNLPLGSFSVGIARGIASDGTIVGVAGIGENDLDNAAVWRSGQLSLLAREPGGDFTDAYAISADGHVIVGRSNGATHTGQPARWVDGVVQPLGDIPGSNSIGKALAVNADGSVIVGEGAGNNRAFRWINGTMEALPLIGESDIQDSTAFDVSANGRRIVGQQTHFNFHTDGLLWEDGVVRNLGYLPGGNRTFAETISDDGSLIFGESGVGFTTGIHAFLWDDANGIQDLMPLLLNAGVDLHGWQQLYLVRDVSADGHTILGYGYDAQGLYSPFLATIPEPGTLSLAAVSFVMLGTRRDRRSAAQRKE